MDTNYFNWKRFDLPIKKLFLELLHEKTTFGEEMYKAHLQVWNGFKEPNQPHKNNYFKFRKEFIDLYEDIKNKQFDWRHSPILINQDEYLIDGAHRLTAALHANVTPHIERTEFQGRVYNYQTFKDIGLDPKHLDATALQLIRLNQNLRVINIFPSARNKREQLISLIQDHTSIAYAKTVQLNQKGRLNYVMQLYRNEPWSGKYETNFHGFRNKANACFSNSGPLQVFIAELPDLEVAQQLKLSIRQLYNIGNHSVHINDTYEETLRLSRSILNENSIHFLNTSEIANNYKYFEHLQKYEVEIDRSNQNCEDFCLLGDAPFALHGLKKTTLFPLTHLSRNKIENNQEHKTEKNFSPIPTDNLTITNTRDEIESQTILSELDNILDQNPEENSFSIMLLWKNDRRIIQQLDNLGTIHFAIPIELYGEGRYNLLDQIHHGKIWWENNLNHEADKRIPNNRFTAIIFTGRDLHLKIKKWKYSTRNQLNLDKTYFHVSDPDCSKHMGQQCECAVSSEFYRQESIRHIHLLFHQNTFDFINRRKNIRLERFDAFLNSYTNSLPANTDDYCVDNGGVLAAYGIRDTHDIDYLTTSSEEINSVDFACENRRHGPELETLGYSISDIINNPSNYFYHYGLKYMSLQIVSDFKFNRTQTIITGENSIRIKDVRDYHILQEFQRKALITDPQADEIFSHPDCHFYFGNVKVASLQAMQEILDATENEIELKLIREHFKESYWKLIAQELMRTKINFKLAIRRIYLKQSRIIRLSNHVKNHGILSVPTKVIKKVLLKLVGGRT